MSIKTASIFPPKRYSVRDLLKPTYQASLHSDMFSLMKQQEHRVINKFFPQLVFTMVNEQAIQLLPSMDPEVILDRILPEMILENPQPLVIKIRLILKTLMPIAHQMKELIGEMKNAFIITAKQDLLEELGKKIIRSQVQIMMLMKKLREEIALPIGAISSAEYTVLKASQCVFHFREIVYRAVNLDLVSNQTAFYRMMKKMDMQQLAVYRFSSVALTSKPMMVPSYVKTPADASNMPMYPVHTYNTMGPSSFPVPIPTPVSRLISSLRALTAEQMSDIVDVWFAETDDRPVRPGMIKMLTINAARNTTLINQFVKMPGFHDMVSMELILQATIQHQIVADMLRAIRFGKNDPKKLASSSNMERYAIKVRWRPFFPSPPYPFPPPPSAPPSFLCLLPSP